METLNPLIDYLGIIEHHLNHLNLQFMLFIVRLVVIVFLYQLHLDFIVHLDYLVNQLTVHPVRLVYLLIEFIEFIVFKHFSYYLDIIVILQILLLIEDLGFKFILLKNRQYLRVLVCINQKLKHIGFLIPHCR